jgi:hypothetical protein
MLRAITPTQLTPSQLEKAEPFYILHNSVKQMAIATDLTLLSP